MVARVLLSYELQIGEGELSEINYQTKLPYVVLRLIREIVMKTWKNVDSDGEIKGSYTKIFQAASTPYAKFLGKLSDTTQMQSKTVTHGIINL